MSWQTGCFSEAEIEAELVVVLIGHLYSALLRDEPIAKALRYGS